MTVQYEHRAKKEFAPSATVFKVLQWAVSKRAYGLDPTKAAKASLILPGADQPLPARTQQWCIHQARTPPRPGRRPDAKKTSPMADGAIEGDRLTLEVHLRKTSFRIGVEEGRWQIPRCAFPALEVRVFARDFSGTAATMDFQLLCDRFPAIGPFVQH